MSLSKVLDTKPEQEAGSKILSKKLDQQAGV